MNREQFQTQHGLPLFHNQIGKNRLKYTSGFLSIQTPAKGIPVANGTNTSTKKRYKVVERLALRLSNIEQQLHLLAETVFGGATHDGDTTFSVDEACRPRSLQKFVHTVYLISPSPLFPFQGSSQSESVFISPLPVSVP